jgi:hypothetical protein
MMTEHFESWYATLDTSLRNMVEGGLVATVCGWFGATLFAAFAAVAWVRGRIRERRRDATWEEYIARGKADPVPPDGCDTPAEPEPKPEPCSPPLSPLAGVLLELFACGAVTPNDDGRGFRVGALRVDGDGYSGPMLLTYPVDGKPTELARLLGEEIGLVRDAVAAMRKRHKDAADEKARERAVAALAAQVAVFKVEPAKHPAPSIQDFLVRVREVLKRADELAKTPAV